MAPPEAPGPIRDFTPLVTAAEAFPALERCFLAARSEIRASFRVFDLTTKLHSREGLAIGETWFDLVVAVLRRGVTIDLTLCDFDPIVARPLHRQSWKSARQFIAANDATSTGRASAHGAHRLHPRESHHRRRGGGDPEFREYERSFTSLGYGGGRPHHPRRPCERAAPARLLCLATRAARARAAGPRDRRQCLAQAGRGKCRQAPFRAAGVPRPLCGGAGPTSRQRLSSMPPPYADKAGNNRPSCAFPLCQNRRLPWNSHFLASGD